MKSEAKKSRGLNCFFFCEFLREVRDFITQLSSIIFIQDDCFEKRGGGHTKPLLPLFEGDGPEGHAPYSDITRVC